MRTLFSVFWLAACGGGERSAEWRHDAELATGPFRLFHERESCTCDVGPNGLWEVMCGPIPVDGKPFYLQFPFPAQHNVREANAIAWTWRTTGYEHRFDGGYAQYTRYPDVELPDARGNVLPFAPIHFDAGYFPAFESCDAIGCDAEDEGDVRDGWFYCRVPL